MSSDAAIPEKLKSILDEINSLEDYQSRMDYLIELGESFEEVRPEIATRPFSMNNKVPACESDAYVFTSSYDGNKTQFHFAIENPHGISAKALAKILGDGLLGESNETISKIPEEIVYQVFGKDLSMGKGLGLMGMIKLVKHLAGQT